MPMKPGTKPNVRQYAEVSYGDLQTALREAVKQKTIRSDVEGKRTVWRDNDGNVIARHNVHKRSEQCVIASWLLDVLPKPRKEDANASA